MRYLLLIGGPETGLSSKDICESVESKAWLDDLHARGVYRGGELLRPVSDATTVRVRDGEVLLSDGPFAETKELIGGINVIECADLDEALEIAAGHPAAKLGMVEVRPIWEP